MSPNHESVNEALSIAREGMNDAERGIEAIRFERIMLALDGWQAGSKLMAKEAMAHNELRAKLLAKGKA
jgi:hypothetical protein